ncbi:glucose dehydrogenase [FAD, quinone]-like [Stomoxys calcitrans]|uniref:Glucose-methanol-choline oxidoreductase N-terminal domain-containing protein n=1 Tax=Stomoxys calcitrans TaxID=35570 RepID=A0A1I8QAE5_STOCA|nr:glucose dehydrogenase [FAD, quinone]-like [Stomoxys calcitrans]
MNFFVVWICWLLSCAPLTGVSGQQPTTNILSFFFNRVREGRAMSDMENSDNQVNLLKNYDFIIVGAGTAGCALAARLSEISQWKVLLLEAGGPETWAMDIPIVANMLQANRDINWAYRTEPSEHYCLGLNGKRCNFPRGRVMGGSSVLNYMIYTRGNRRDYDTWAQLGNEGWSYAEVLPYFKKLEGSLVPNAEANYVGRQGPVKVSYAKWRSSIGKAFVNAALQNGSQYVDYNGKQQIGVSFLQTTTDQVYRWSANRAYLYPIKGKRPNLHIRKYAMVTKVLIDPFTKVAYGVVFESQGQSFEVRARKEVILSAGAINTPQLLMLSGVGPAKHLRAVGIEPLVNLAVGYNLQDHVAPALNIITNATTMRLGDFFDVDQLLRLETRDSKFSLAGSVETIAFYDMEPSGAADGWPDFELFMTPGALNENPFLASAMGIKGDVMHALYDDVYRNNFNTFLIFAMQLQTRSKGRIILRNKDPLQHPLIYPNYFKDPYDLEVLLQGLEKIISLLDMPAMRRIDAKLLNSTLPQCRQYADITSRAYLECYARQLTFTIYHQAGTAKMGPISDREAVVDPRLRVYGIKQLRVVDASIMPKLVAGHPNGPVFMIAEKAADMIKEDYGFLRH